MSGKAMGSGNPGRLAGILLCLLGSLTAAAAAGAASSGAGASPRVGDPAPSLEVGDWLKGEQIDRLVSGRVYLIDIWAPWCGPCVGGMAHLTDLQRRYRDRGLVVVGLTGPDDYGSTRAAAMKVLAEKGAAVGYSIAWDSERKNYGRWMALEHDQGWPWSFIVDRQGRVAFSGHPEKLDGVLAQVVAGAYNLDQAAATYGRRLQAVDAAQRLRAARKARNWTAASSLFEQTRSLDPEVAGIQANGLYRALVEAKETARAAAFGRRVVSEWSGQGERGEHAAADAEVLERLAGLITDTAKPLAPRDLDLALLAARNAVALTANRDAEALATLARALFLHGDRSLAVSTQERALALSAPEDKQERAQDLAKYKAGAAKP